MTKPVDKWTIASDIISGDYILLHTASGVRRITLSSFNSANANDLVSLGFVQNNNFLIKRKITSIVDDVTASVTDHDIILANCAAIDITVTMPLSSAMYNTSTLVSHMFTIKRTDISAVFTCTIQPSGGNLIDSLSTKVLSGTNLASVNIIADGSNLYTI